MNRRDFLRTGSALAAFPSLYAQERQIPARTADEMTVNASANQEFRAHYDFGPLPAQLPADTRALAGSNSLRAHGAARGLLAGAAVSVSQEIVRDPAVQQLIADQFGILVPRSELKWRELRPARDRFDFAKPDALLAFAEKHGIPVRGHTLAWHNSVPDWIERDAATLPVRQLFVEHIRTVVGRYRGRIHSWDVVNEAILPADKQPNGLRNSFWFQHVGPDYIDLAFRTAREADPHARLTYNDYGVEYDNAEQEERRRIILDLLHRMQAAHTPLDAVGIQAHIKAPLPAPVGKGLRDYMGTIRDMGLEICLTELDVNGDDVASNNIAVRDLAAADSYAQFLDVALANTAVKAVLTWGVTDRGTWLNDGPTHHRKQPDRPQRSLLFDTAYHPVPAFFAMRDRIDAAPKR